MSILVSPAVLNATHVLFTESEWAEVLRLLEERCGTNLPLMPNGDAGRAVERIRLAVLKLSGGSMTALEQAVATAERDWRDVLVFAGFGDDSAAHLRWLPGKPDLQS